MLISVIVPVYNSSLYLKRCLESLLAQDYTSLEIILIDDGSTDESPQICDHFAEQYSNIKVKHIANRGASLARKIGLDEAQGFLLTFIDSDDYVQPNYLSSLYKALMQENTEIAGCGVLMLKNEDCLDSLEFVDDSKFCLLEGDKLMFRFFNYEFWGLPAALYKRDVFDSIYFPKATLSEDYFIKAQMFVRQCKMAYVDAPLYIYEKHEGSLSNTSLSMRAFDEFVNVRFVYELMQKKEPKYIGPALKNVVETCVKLILMGTASERINFKQQYQEIYLFLKGHVGDICDNSHLLFKVKTLALSFLYFPFLIKIINRIK